jgi:hypothetical protein
VSMKTGSQGSDLLDELRRECPEAPVSDARGKAPRPDEEWFVTISDTELATFITKREHAAAERMRTEASGLVRHVLGQKPPEPAAGHPVNSRVVRQELRAIADAIDELEPEEPSE